MVRAVGKAWKGRETEMASVQLLDQVIAAHGGRRRWQQVERIYASLSSGGFAFSSKFQGTALRGLQVSLDPHGGRVSLRNFVHPGWRGIWTPEHVQIQDDSGRLVAQRAQPRAQFARWTEQLRWDKLDILYFAGYALWNYLSFPFLLEYDDVSVTAPASGNVPGWRRLDAHFDVSVPTHSVQQSFHVDQNGHLLRHDYTADVIGSWAHAANCCLASQTVEGFRFYTRRKVFPLMGRNTVLPFPTLVWIELDDIVVKLDQDLSAPAPTPGENASMPL